MALDKFKSELPISFDGLNGHAQALEMADRGTQERLGALLGLVGVDLRECDSAVVVDGDEDVVPADVTCSLSAISGDAMPDLVEAAQLLDVDVQQVTRRVALAALDVFLRTQVGQLRHAGTLQDTADRPARDPRVGGNACLQEQLSAQLDDSERDAGIVGSRRQRWSRRFVGQCRRAAGQIAAMPLPGRDGAHTVCSSCF